MAKKTTEDLSPSESKDFYFKFKLEDGGESYQGCPWENLISWTLTKTRPDEQGNTKPILVIEVAPVFKEVYFKGDTKKGVTSVRQVHNTNVTIDDLNDIKRFFLNRGVPLDILGIF